MIPPEANGEFVARMEDVLEVYHRPYDERWPLVCLDEVPVQLVGETVCSCQPSRGSLSDTTTSTGARAPRTCSWPSSRSWAGGG